MMDTSISRTESAVTEYRDSLLRIEKATDILLLAIQNWDADDVNRLIETRESLCAEIGPRMANLMSVLGDDSTDIITEVESLHARLASKQAACESALSAGLDECRQELLSLNQHKGAVSAYRGQPIIRQARFLDSRL
jgi:hypothetical protein